MRNNENVNLKSLSDLKDISIGEADKNFMISNHWSTILRKLSPDEKF